MILRCPKPVNIAAISVSLSGCETPAAAALARALRRSGSFFFREIILSGSEQPRRTSERLSRLWNAFLGRKRGRTLSPGEHIYPFFISLPASLPPSYRGRAGSIDYRVAARVRFPLGRSLWVSRDVQVVFVPRRQTFRPIALSYPDTPGAVHSSQTRVNLEFERRSVETGQAVRGRFSIANPQKTNVPRAEASLELCEWVRTAGSNDITRVKVDSVAVEPSDPSSAMIESDFELHVPPNAPPTVEGTAISVMWLLKLAVESDPPLELKAPITVHSPLD